MMDKVGLGFEEEMIREPSCRWSMVAACNRVCNGIETVDAAAPRAELWPTHSPGR